MRQFARVIAALLLSAFVLAQPPSDAGWEMGEVPDEETDLRITYVQKRGVDGPGLIPGMLAIACNDHVPGKVEVYVAVQRHMGSDVRYRVSWHIDSEPPTDSFWMYQREGQVLWADPYGIPEFVSALRSASHLYVSTRYFTTRELHFEFDLAGINEALDWLHCDFYFE